MEAANGNWERNHGIKKTITTLVHCEQNTSYIVAAPRKVIFVHPFRRANTDFPVTKFGYGLLLGCRSGLDRIPDKKTFFGDVDVRNVIGEKPRKKVFTGCSGTLTQSIERGRISRKKPLMFVRVENGVTKFSPQRQKTTPKFSKKNIGSGKPFSVRAIFIFYWPREN